MKPPQQRNNNASVVSGFSRTREVRFEADYLVPAAFNSASCGKPALIHLRNPLTRNQFASSFGHSDSAGSAKPSPVP
jgi:hypothetical protein